MPQAFATYDRLWTDLGTTHYLPTGMVMVSRSQTDWSERAKELDRLKVLHRLLSPQEVAARLPMLHAKGIIDAFEAGGAGMLFASRIVIDLARWVAEHGVALHPHTKVDDIDVTTGRLTAGGIRHDADLVVVAAGAWLPELVPETARRMVPSRQLLLYLEPPKDLVVAWSTAPVLVDSGGGHGAYIQPPRGGTRLKIGDHIFTRRGHGSDDRLATAEDVAPVIEAASAIFARFEEYKILERKVCYYTVTKDEGFVVEPLGSAGWVLSACSGHGFKLGPLIASGLAEVITGSRSSENFPKWAAGQTLDE
jgi:sarcosine oxidase/sarcosine oxidase subunit beta